MGKMQPVLGMSRGALETEVEELRYKLSEITGGISKNTTADKLGLKGQLRTIFSVLEYAKGAVVSLTSLHESLYVHEPETAEKMVQVQIVNLRRRLKGTPYEILNSWGDGYAMITPKAERLAG